MCVCACVCFTSNVCVIDSQTKRDWSKTTNGCNTNLCCVFVCVTNSQTIRDWSGAKVWVLHKGVSCLCLYVCVYLGLLYALPWCNGQTHFLVIL